MKKTMKTTSEKLLENLTRTSPDYDDVEYDNYYACQNGSDCCDGDYCRCGTIENARVINNIKTWELLEGNYWTGDIDDTEIILYCLERILSINEVWDKDNWEVNICGGYYGQELNGISLDDGLFNKIKGQLKEFDLLDSDRERIEYVLNLEYGFIIDSLKGKDYEVIMIDKDEVVFGQLDYHGKLNQKIKDYYKDYSLARGIVIRDGNKYRCIDGYHRITGSDGTIFVILGR